MHNIAQKFQEIKNYLADFVTDATIVQDAIAIYRTGKLFMKIKSLRNDLSQATSPDERLRVLKKHGPWFAKAFLRASFRLYIYSHTGHIG